MERSTGKTMDCFVEFVTNSEAREAVSRIDRLHEVSQGPRMGNRHVDVSLSSQDALLKALFPKAKCIRWEAGRPVQLPKRADEEWSTGFVGFMTDEELFCVARHAKEPHRSAFAGKVPQRTYESIISTIWKFPWYAVNMYTVHARNKLYETLRTMIEALLERLCAGRTVGLDRRLLSELLRAGLECPAFNPRMKWTLATCSDEQQILSRMHEAWLPYFPFDTLTWLPPNNPTALEFYAMLIAKGRIGDVAEGLKNCHTRPEYLEPYGKKWFEWRGPVTSEKKFSEAIQHEKQVLVNLLTTGYNVMKNERPRYSSHGIMPRPASATTTHASVDNQPGGVPLVGSSQMPSRQTSSVLSSGQPTSRANPRHQQTGSTRPHEETRWPSQGPNPYDPDPPSRRPLGPPAPPAHRGSRGSRGSASGHWRGLSGGSAFPQ
ncbi:uncharacterized protein N7482_004929 [Penicillium canariense]|uniref:RRM domain-containing protein n=1 Tax=Penicillium canariense TaxID=189055 RepID=A0A9W9LMY9_9EURO|nr:uncharacterized protein N7482_004929 [Penicillium canariense]KAJ5166148.1 hypothetical protein N7482_004929 [Penicillium canariense]